MALLLFALMSLQALHWKCIKYRDFLFLYRYTYRLGVIAIKQKMPWIFLIFLILYALLMAGLSQVLQPEATVGEAVTVPKLNMATVRPAGMSYELDEIRNNSSMELVLGASVCRGVVGMVGLSLQEDATAPLMAVCYRNNTVEKLNCAIPPAAIARKIVCAPEVTYCILEQPDAEERWLLTGYNGLGRKVLSRNISAFVPENTGMTELGYLSSGHLVLATQNNAVIFDLEGHIQAVLKFTGRNTGIFTDNRGAIILQNYREDRITLYKIREDWKAEAWLEFSADYNHYTFFSGGSSDYSFFLYNYTRLYGYDDASGTFTEIFAFADLGVSYAEIDTILYTEDGQFFLAYWDIDTDTDDFYRIVSTVKTAANKPLPLGKVIPNPVTIRKLRQMYYIESALISFA